MRHLEKLMISPHQFTLGFFPPHDRYFTWQTYLDTWKLVDRGIEDPFELPLFFSMNIYYGSQPEKRLIFERDFLGIKSTDPMNITCEWVKRHIKLYHSIKEDGYRPERRNKPIEVVVNDKGQIWLIDGTHTVSILKHLKHKDKIEATVIRRCKKWMEFKENMYKMYGKKLLYQPVDHPDFDDWKIDRLCEDRWMEIEPYLGDVNGKHVLDIGCNYGWFSRKLVDRGAHVLGVDSHLTRFQACKLFSGFHGYKAKNPLFLPITFEELLTKHIKDQEGNKLELTLMLSVIHHYIRRNPEEAWKALKLVSKYSNRLILELGTNKLPLKWYPELVLKHSEYTQYIVIREEERPIYLYE